MAGRKFGLILNLTKFQYKSRCHYSKYPVQQYVGELEFDELTLDLYKEGKEKSVVYEDAQDGYDYKR
jgi:hypothetical protein